MSNIISRKRDMAVVTKTLAIRAGAGNMCVVCPTCTRPASAGYRKCVDACHVPHETLVANNRSAWLSRPEAREIRMAELVRISG